MTDALPATTPSPLPSPPITGERERIHAIDYAKGVGILLVVLGHVWRGLDKRIALPEPIRDGGAIDRWVYGFHMPLFFFVSGLFLYRSAGKPSKAYLADKLSTILWPYLLWSAVMWQLAALVGGSRTGVGAFGLSLIGPQTTHLWFLWVLFWIAIFILALRKLKLPAVGVFVVSIAIYFAARHGWHVRIADATHLPIAGSLFQFAMFFPYVAAAAMVASPLLSALARFPIWAWAALTIVSASVVTYMTRTGTSGNEHMFNFASGSAGIVMVLGLARILEHDRIMSFKFLGQRSLEIYLVHILAASAVRIVLLKLNFTDWWVHLPLSFIGGVLGPLALWHACRLVRFPFLFRLPGPAGGNREA